MKKYTGARIAIRVIVNPSDLEGSTSYKDYISKELTLDIDAFLPSAAKAAGKLTGETVSEILNIFALAEVEPAAESESE